MKETGRTKWSIALSVLIMVLLVGCATEDGDDAVKMNADITTPTDHVGYGIYSGEWTVNKQVVDTARLIVTDKLSMRLPENYLTRLCLQHDSTLRNIPDYDGAPKTQGTVNVIRFTIQGYSDNALFSTFFSAFSESGSENYYIPASFEASIGGYPFRIDLLSTESCNLLYREDTGLWTIVISIIGFHTNCLDTGEQTECKLPAPVTLYYNARERIG